MNNGILTALVALSVLFLAGCEVSASAGAAERNQQAQQLVEQIAAELVEIRQVGETDASNGRQLTLSAVLDRIDMLESVGDSIEQLHENFADTEVANSREVRRMVNRRESHYNRMLRMRERLQG